MILIPFYAMNLEKVSKELENLAPLVKGLLETFHTAVS